MDAGSVLLSVAPVDAADTEYFPEKTAADVIRCAAYGAGMVHLHVRDSHGRLTSDMSLFDETVRLIRKESDIVIEASTGGVSELTIQERCAPLYDSLVEFCSLNVGSVNLGEAVYKNPPCDVRYCVEQIVKTGKIPEVEVFEIGMIDTMQKLQEKYGLKLPVLYSVVLGHDGAAPATSAALRAMAGFIPADSVWGITHAHRSSDEIITEAIRLGACTVRVGFEDSHIAASGVTAETNAPVIQHYAQIIRDCGKGLMTPAQLRQWLVK